VDSRPVANKLFSGVAAVCLDLDDTLCGYWDASKAGLNQAFTQNPVPGVTPERMVLAWADAFRKFSPNLKLDRELYDSYLESGSRTRLHQIHLTLQEVGVVDNDLALKISEDYRRFRNQNLRLFHDAIAVLETLFAHFPLGLITNGPADIQNEEVDTLGIRKYFKSILIEGEMKIGKPQKQVFERAERELGVCPEQMLMVGNSFHHDIVPAIKYGWKTAWTRRDSDVPPSSKTGQPDELPEGGPFPTLIVDSLSAILPHLDL
jgi:putative hydrolase of the HAD superfamily